LPSPRLSLPLFGGPTEHVLFIFYLLVRFLSSLSPFLAFVKTRHGSLPTRDFHIYSLPCVVLWFLYFFLWPAKTVTKYFAEARDLCQWHPSPNLCFGFFLTMALFIQQSGPLELCPLFPRSGNLLKKTTKTPPLEEFYFLQFPSLSAPKARSFVVLSSPWTRINKRGLELFPPFLSGLDSPVAVGEFSILCLPFGAARKRVGPRSPGSRGTSVGIIFTDSLLLRTFS